MNIKDRLVALREKMTARNIGLYYVPSSDPHMCEYLPEQYKSREFISGFNGSAGDVIVTPTSAGLWTDGRYFLQAEKQLAGSGIELFKAGLPGVPSVFEFMKNNSEKGTRLGFDGKTVSLRLFNELKKSNPQLEIVDDIDLIGEIWADRPGPVLSKAFILEEKYSGMIASKKIKALREKLESSDLSCTVISALEDICYLFNIRGNDIKCNPVINSYALIDKERAVLFVNPSQISDEVKKNLEAEGVSLADYEDVFKEAEKLTGNVLLDPTRTNVYLFKKIHAKVVLGKNLTVDMKAKKNDVELQNFRRAMVVDGLAMIKIFKWLEENVKNSITEFDVCEQLFKFRSEGEGFVEESFDTIAGYGPNGAIVHYGPEKETAATLKPKSFLLLDSGGHYFTGTTDITRTIPLGPLTEEEKINYTTVLKGHIRLALAKFRAGITGFALDTLAREPLWAMGKDFNHGTGHGVGYLLAVHEGPQSISQRFINEPIVPGMITSNEPGIYIANSHGIRIESLVATKNFKTTDFGDFYEFETITVCPIHTEPVIKDLLTAEELEWLNSYNAECEKLLAPELDEAHKEFLHKITRPL